MNPKNLVKFFVYSNLYLSFGSSIVAFSVIYFMKLPLNDIIVLLIPFFCAFFIYNLNRLSDIEEDKINVPERYQFSIIYTKKIFVFALSFYFMALFFSLFHNIMTFIIVLLLPLCGVFYCILRWKQYFIIKNIIVAFVWAGSVIFVGAYYNIINLELLLLYIFFFSQFLINVIVFDIKDVIGDKINKIYTLPVKYGIRKTKMICGLIFIIFFLSFLSLLYINFNYFLLLPFVIYTFTFIVFANEKSRLPWWYYGVFVDGEFYVLLISLILPKILGLVI